MYWACLPWKSVGGTNMAHYPFTWKIGSGFQWARYSVEQNYIYDLDPVFLVPDRSPFSMYIQYAGWYNYGGSRFSLVITLWRHQMESFSALLALCAGNSPVTGEFPVQKPVTRSFDVFFDLRLNEQLSKQSWGWWFETPSRPLWCHCYDNCTCWSVTSMQWNTFIECLYTHVYLLLYLRVCNR